MKPPKHIVESFDRILNQADLMYLSVKKMSGDEKFSKLDPEKKFACFYNKNKDFCKAFPVVTKYIICLEEYSRVALKRYLIRVHITRSELSRNYSNSTEEQRREIKRKWDAKRKAEYLLFLWEDKTVYGYNKDKSIEVFQKYHESLCKEIEEFVDMEKKAKSKIKDLKNTKKMRNIQNLLKRLKSGDHHLDEKSVSLLINRINSKLKKEKIYNTREKPYYHKKKQT